MKNFSKSDYIKSEYNKINNLFLSGKFDIVIEKSKKLIKKNPTQIPFYNFLALSYREKGEIFLAEKILQNALKISPNNQSVLINLGSTYRVLIEFDKSEKFLKKVLSINPNNINAIVNYANLKKDTNNYDESIELYEKAYKMNNKIPTIIINLAGAYQIVGKFDLSQSYLEILLKEDQNNALAHKMLSTIKKYKKNDPHQTQMNLILKKNNLKEIDKATLMFAISKSYEDQKDYKNSFISFKIANDIQKKIHKNYSINEEAKLFKKIKGIFEETDFKSYTQFTGNKKLIFIVGLPRSGTTLTHQILAAHSKVHGAGEIVILDQWMMKKISNQNFISLFKNHSINSDEKIKAIINNYFTKISYIKANKNIILDKNPLNFQWLGFIKILFPNAKIIHCTRNLKDTALSIYKNAFEINSLVWSNDQEDLVQYISLYLDLMKFWKKKIPNFIYNLNYEKLINNQKEQTQKLLNFCELNWEEDCLNFNKKATPIKTVSVTQARKPIYKTSLNSYLKYYNYLDMFKKIEEIEKT
jgi:tetratricopeptide (TPR) repeat protein